MTTLTSVIHAPRLAPRLVRNLLAVCVYHATPQSPEGRPAVVSFYVTSERNVA
jgi:hypothetical protein